MRRLLKFLTPSIAGAFFFLFPVRYGGTYMVPLAILTDKLNVFLGASLPFIVVAISAMSAVMSVYWSWIARASSATGPAIRRLFVVQHGWVILRIAGCVVGTIIVWKLGPEIVWSDDTGHVVVYDLATAIVTIFIFASFLLPLLTDFGLMELVGTIFPPSFSGYFDCPDAPVSMRSHPGWLLLRSVF